MPLLTLAQDIETGDLAVGPRGLLMAEGADAVVVLATNALRQQPGDDPVEPWRGIPYNELLGKRPSPAAIEGLLRRKLGEVPRSTVISVRAEIHGESVDVDAVLRTTEGQVVVSATVT